MSDEYTNYSRQQTVGGSRIGSKGAAPAVYEAVSPYGNQRADFQLIAAAADGACQLWLSDNVTDLVNAASAITAPTDIPAPSNLMPIVFAAANTVTFNELSIEASDRVYLLVQAAADNIRGWIIYKWEKEAVRLDFYNAVFKAQEAAVAALAVAQEVSKQQTWLDKLRQIPAPWSMPGQGQAANKETRPPAPTLYQQRQATNLSPGAPDQPRNKANRLTRG